MALPRKGRRKLVVDGRVFYAIASCKPPNEAGNVSVSVVAHLEGNDNAKLVVQGLTSRSYWHDYPDDVKFLGGRLSISPKVIVTLIRHCVTKGWDPEGPKPKSFLLDNKQLRAILRSQESDT